MSSTKVPIDKPTRGTIEKLLRDLSDVSYDGSEFQRVSKELEQLEAKLLNVPEYKRLKAKRDRAQDKYYDLRRLLKKMVEEVKTSYRLKGLTDEVLAEIAKVVEFKKSHDLY